MRRLSRERAGVLGGHTIFLSASVPTRAPFERRGDAAFHVEQAVTSLVRAVFAEDGRLVFGGHPSISPLVASIATEYFPVRPDGASPPIDIYQSRAYEGFLPDKTWDMQRFGFARIHWSDAVNGERFDPALPSLQCQDSLRAMRRMLLEESRPTALVAIGGMEGVLHEAQLCGQQGRDTPFVVFTVRETGGAAELLATGGIPARPEWALLRGAQTDPTYTPVTIRVVDDEWRRTMPEAVERTDRPDPRARSVPPPYPVMMQWLVHEIATLPRTPPRR